MTLALLPLMLLVHEAGHALAARGLGFGVRPFAHVKPLRFGVAVQGTFMSPRNSVLIALAGPAASLELAAPLMALHLGQAAAVTIGIGLANLIPFPKSDGSHVIAALRSARA
jgi:Zn-dependent protease